MWLAKDDAKQPGGGYGEEGREKVHNIVQLAVYTNLDRGAVLTGNDGGNTALTCIIVGV